MTEETEFNFNLLKKQWIPLLTALMALFTSVAAVYAYVALTYSLTVQWFSSLPSDFLWHVTALAVLFLFTVALALLAFVAVLKARGYFGSESWAVARAKLTDPWEELSLEELRALEKLSLLMMSLFGASIVWMLVDVALAEPLSLVFNSLMFWIGLALFLVTSVSLEAKEGRRMLTVELELEDVQQYEPLSEQWWHAQHREDFPTNWEEREGVVCVSSVVLIIVALVVFSATLQSPAWCLLVPTVACVAALAPIYSVLWRQEKVRLSELDFDLERYETLNLARMPGMSDEWVDRLAPWRRLVLLVSCVVIVVTFATSQLWYPALPGIGAFIGVGIWGVVIGLIIWQDERVRAARDKAVEKGYVDVPAVQGDESS